MKLYLLRHGKADWPNWNKPDDERPLTSEGKKEASRMAKLLQEMKIKPALVLSSPLPRAWQTAEIVADQLALPLEKEETLGKGFDAAALRKMIERNAGEDVMVVGHEPDFSAVIRALTGGDVKLAKGAVARVDLEAGAKTGRLIWLIPPKAAP